MAKPNAAVVLRVVDMWFDCGRGKSTLRIAVEQPHKIEAFAAYIHGDESPPLIFMMLADIRDRRIFEAVSQGEAADRRPGMNGVLTVYLHGPGGWPHPAGGK